MFGIQYTDDLDVGGEATKQSTETVGIGLSNHGLQSGPGTLGCLAASSQPQPRDGISHLLVERDQMNIQATLQGKTAYEGREVRNTPEQSGGLFGTLSSQGIKVVDVKRLEDMRQQVSEPQRLPFRHRRFLEHPFEFRDAADSSLVVIVELHAQAFVGTLGFGKRRVLQADGVDQRLKYRLFDGLFDQRAVTFRERRCELAKEFLAAGSLRAIGGGHDAVAFRSRESKVRFQSPYRLPDQ